MSRSCRISRPRAELPAGFCGSFSPPSLSIRPCGGGRPNWELCAVPCTELYQKRPKRRDFFNRTRKYAAMNEPVRCRRRGRWWDSSSRGGPTAGAGSVQLAVPFFLAFFPSDSFWMYILGSGVIGNKNLCFDDCRGAAHYPASWACLPLGCSVVRAPTVFVSGWLGLMGAVPVTCEPGQVPYVVWACC
jgi:hypothetical protein